VPSYVQKGYAPTPRSSRGPTPSSYSTRHVNKLIFTKNPSHNTLTKPNPL